MYGYRSLLRKSLPNCLESACSEAVVFKKSISISSEVECLDVAVWIILIYAGVMTLLGSPPLKGKIHAPFGDKWIVLTCRITIPQTGIWHTSRLIVAVCHILTTVEGIIVSVNATLVSRGTRDWERYVSMLANIFLLSNMRLGLWTNIGVDISAYWAVVLPS